MNLNQTPRDKTRKERAATVEEETEKQDAIAITPFRPVIIPKLKRPVTI